MMSREISTRPRRVRHRLAARLAVVGVVGLGSLTLLTGGGSSSANAPAGWEIAYQGENGDVFLVNTATATPTDLGIAMAADASPAVSSDGKGGYLVAFDGSNGHLETYDTRSGGGATDTLDAMAAGTTPSIGLSASGALTIAFQAASGGLSFFTPLSHDTNSPTISGSPIAMAPGTSPSLAPNAPFGWKVAYQARDGSLDFFTWRTATPTSMSTLEIRPSMASGTSPSLALRPSGGFEIAWQANNNHNLMTYLTAGAQTINTEQPMEAGTSPSVAATNGADEVAFQSSFGHFATYDSRHLMTDTGESMGFDVSPSIASAQGAGWNAAFGDEMSHLAVYGATTSDAMAASTSPAIATNVASPSRTNSFAFYEQDTTSSQECSAASGDPLVAPSTCLAWNAPPRIITPGGFDSPGDFCLNYGAINGTPITSSDQLATSSSANLVGKVGFSAPSSNQLRDDRTGTTCSTNAPNSTATAGMDSLWGLLLKGNASNGFCITNCGLQHVITWRDSFVRPWMANGQLQLQTGYDAVSDNVNNALVQQSVWHSYLCPFIRDVSSPSSTEGFELCEELWRSDHSQVGLCTSASEAGANICMNGGEVTTICDEDPNGFDECLYPDFASGYTIAWTRPQAGTKFSTSTGSSYQDNNVFGNHLFKVTITQANLLEVVRLFNLALSIDQGNGLFLGTSSLSTNPSDYAVVIMEDGQEGNAINGSTTATLGANISNLSAISKY
jgi:hypothetical protein